MVAYVQNTSVNAIVKRNNMDGVFTGDYYGSGADRARFKIVPLSPNITIESAHDKPAGWLKLR